MTTRRRLGESVGRLIASTHTRLFRLTKGKVGGKIGAAPILLLSVTGRRSGETHSTPLVYLQDGADFIVIASNGGRAADPSWRKNLSVTPSATVEVGGEKIPVQASELVADEREQFFSVAKKLFSGYEKYERSTSRTIPIIRLTRVP